MSRQQAFRMNKLDRDGSSASGDEVLTRCWRSGRWANFGLPAGSSGKEIEVGLFWESEGLKLTASRERMPGRIERPDSEAKYLSAKSSEMELTLSKFFKIGAARKCAKPQECRDDLLIHGIELSGD